MRALLLIGLFVSVGASANLYSYVNDQGEYVISRDKPRSDDREYAVLSDDGEFIRLVQGSAQNVPITHWRPWFLPKAPHPMDGRPEEIEPPTPVVTVEEVDE